MKLTKYKLGDIAEIVPGYAFKASDFGTGDNIALKIKDISPFTVDTEGADRVLYTPNDRFKVKTGDYVMAMTGATIGKVGKILSQNKNIFINQRVCKFIPNESICNKDFLFYVLNTEYFKQFVYNNVDSKAAQPNIGHPTLYKFDVELPDLDTQRRIASVLSNLDRKIALNRQINTNLEALARQLYDYWFVQFDFPDANGNPYKSSGGKMTYNEKLKRHIPDGWEVKSINQISSLCRGVSYTKDDLLNQGGILVLRGNNIDNNRLVYDANVALVPYNLVSPEQHLYKGDIVMTMSSGSKEHIGKCIYFYQDSEHTFGAFLSKITPVRKYAPMAFLYFCSDFYKSKIKSICSGTGINNLTNQTFDDIFLVIPDERTLQEFNVIIEPIFDATGNNEREISSLTRQRDELLPLLMNGQVSVE